MLTPVDIANHTFKGGIGYDKKDVDVFITQLASDYQELYSSNVELKDKITTLNESLQHYRSIEDSMQKALTLSEKTAEETVNVAKDKARQIANEAELKAEATLVNSKAELQSIKDEIYLLQQQFNTYKQQFNKILDMQKKLMDSDMVNINLGDDYEPSAEVYGGFSGLFNNDSGLGGGLGSGTYVGSNDNSGRERPNQEPAFDRGTSLNMDPFADAANGGGRFSRQTGGVYTGAKKNANKANKTTTSDGLNMKDASYNKVKRTVVASAPNTTPEPTNVTEEQLSEEPKTTQTVTKDDVLEAINAVRQVVEQEQQQTSDEKKSDSIKEESNQKEYTLYTEDEISTPKETETTSEATIQSETLSENIDSTKPEKSQKTDSAMDIDTSTKSNNPVVENTEDTLTGDVESKINESNRIDSDDNYDAGFDFIADDSVDNLADNSEGAFATTNTKSEDETYSGEVESKVNESHMIDSEDNHGDAFDFIVDEEDEEEIPTIFTATTNMNSFNASNNVNTADDNTIDDAVSSKNDVETENGVLMGDVEVKTRKSNWIGNFDDDDEGFNFIS